MVATVPVYDAQKAQERVGHLMPGLVHPITET